MLIKLAFLKVFILIKQVNQKSVLFATIIVFYIRGLSFNKISTMKLCHDVLMVSINFEDVAI